MTTGMGSVDLTGIVERDAEVGDPFDEAWRARSQDDQRLQGAKALDDRRALLGLLRETRQSFLNVEWNSELMCPWCDGERPNHRPRCTQADLLTRLAALLDPATTEPKEPE